VQVAEALVEPRADSTGLVGFASNLVIRRPSIEAGVERGSAIAAPAFSDAAICFRPDVRRRAFLGEDEAGRARDRACRPLPPIMVVPSFRSNGASSAAAWLGVFPIEG
jgi:hypothetical protein